VNINKIHGFDLPPGAAIKLQSDLAASVVTSDDGGEIRLIAGVDVSVGRQGTCGRAAVVVVVYPSLEIVAESTYEGFVSAPYIPGLLSFRELPLILPALEKLELEPDLFIVDGQGIAHPRRLGIAAHLGLFTGKPTIGCAKSRLCGVHSDVGFGRGESAELIADNEIIGKVVRTKEGCKPVFVSVGFKLSLEMAVAWVLKLGAGYRLPEPVRLAHLAAGIKPVVIN
jgi:deoxyribonuclease V